MRGFRISGEVGGGKRGRKRLREINEKQDDKIVFSATRKGAEHTWRVGPRGG